MDFHGDQMRSMGQERVRFSGLYLVVSYKVCIRQKNKSLVACEMSRETIYKIGDESRTSTLAAVGTIKFFLQHSCQLQTQ